MPICSGSTQPKPATPDAVYVSLDYVASLLPAQLAWLIPFLPYAKPMLVEDVLAFCSSEPTLPSLTGVTIGAVLAGGELGASIVAAEAITQIALYYLWLGLCECASGSATPATPPSAPSGLPSVNPPGVVSPTLATPCAYRSYLTLAGLQADTYVVEPSNTTDSSLKIPIGVPGATSFRATFSVVNTYGSNHVVTRGTDHIQFFDLAGTDKGTYSDLAQSGNMTQVLSGPIPVNAYQFRAEVFGDATLRNDHGLVSIEWYCAGQFPGQPLPGCCPPDATAQGLLKQILESVTLLQRQAAPFSYVYGDNHTALSGHGSFAVADLLGVSVDVTTLPDSYGRSDGSPEILFDIGYVTLGTSDGYAASSRISSDGTLHIPPLGGVYTVVGYTLRPGVEVSIRELVREP